MQDLVTAVAEMMEDEAMTLTKKYVEEGVPALQIIDAYKEALSIIGKRFEECTYFVPELILAGEMMKAASEIIKPLMKDGESNVETQRIGKFLLGTVEIHAVTILADERLGRHHDPSQFPFFRVDDRTVHPCLYSEDHERLIQHWPKRHAERDVGQAAS